MPRSLCSKNLSPSVRVAVALYLSNCAIGGQLPKGTVKATATAFGIGRTFVWKIWRLRRATDTLLAPSYSVRPSPTKLAPEEVAMRVKAMPLCQRQTLRSLSQATGIPTTTLSRHLSSKTIRRAVCRVKPTITTEHKRRRLAFALAQVQRPIGTMLIRNNTLLF